MNHQRENVRVFRIADLVKEKGVTDNRDYGVMDVSYAACLPYQTVKRYMEGTPQTISPSVARKFAAFLGVKPFELFDTGDWK